MQAIPWCRSTNRQLQPNKQMGKIYAILCLLSLYKKRILQRKSAAMFTEQSCQHKLNPRIMIHPEQPSKFGSNLTCQQKQLTKWFKCTKRLSVSKSCTRKPFLLQKDWGLLGLVLEICKFM
jgi:hypothetical protein